MTKYSTNLKIEIANTILKHQDSVNRLSKKYNIPKSNIKRWLYVARYQGLTALAVKRTKCNYSTEFKLNVVKYYLNHNLGINPVAAKFNLGPTTIILWTKIFQELGAIGLIPKKKGKLPMNKGKLNNKKELPLSEKEEYEQKIAELEQKVYDLELSNYCLKGLRAVMKEYQTK